MSPKALDVVKRLKKEGFSASQAEIIVKILGETMEDERNKFVTKDYFKSEMTSFKAEVREDFNGFKTEVRKDMADLKTQLSIEMRDLMITTIKWIVGLQFSMLIGSITITLGILYFLLKNGVLFKIMNIAQNVSSISSLQILG